MRKRIIGLAATTGLVCGVVVGSVVGAFGQSNAGTFHMAPDSSLHVSCANALSNASVAASSETVNCAANPPPTTNPPPPPTTTPPPPPTTNPPPPPSSNCTSDPQGSLGPFDYSGISNSNGFNTYVGNNMWGANSGTTQTVCGTGPGNWTLAANAGPGDYTGVQTYPDIQQLTNDYTGNDTWNGSGTMTDTPIADLHTLSSTYSITNPPATAGDWEAAYDIWTSSGELMIWTTYSNERLNNNGATVENANVVIGGQSYTDMNYQGGLPQMVLNSNNPSGTIDILGVLKYWQSQGELSPTATIGQLDYGWEICNTAGTTQNFAVNGYSLTMN